LQRIYADIEELVKARQKESRSEDVVEMLRNAFRLLDKLDRDRPDSGFGEPLDLRRPLPAKTTNMYWKNLLMNLHLCTTTWWEGKVDSHFIRCSLVRQIFHVEFIEV